MMIMIGDGDENGNVVIGDGDCVDIAWWGVMPRMARLHPPPKGV